MGRGKVVSTSSTKTSPTSPPSVTSWWIVLCTIESGDPSTAVAGNVYQCSPAPVSKPIMDNCSGTVANSCVKFQFSGDGSASSPLVIDPASIGTGAGC
jgi:hypothetical protein